MRREAVSSHLPFQMGAAESRFVTPLVKISKAGRHVPARGGPRRGQYGLCIHAMTPDGWARRGTAASERGAFATVEKRAFRQIPNQLKLTEPASKSGTQGA